MLYYIIENWTAVLENFKLFCMLYIHHEFTQTNAYSIEFSHQDPPYSRTHIDKGPHILFILS